MKILTILMPMMIILSCLFALILMNQYSIEGAEWDTILGYLVITIPVLIGLILGLYFLIRRR